MMEYEDLLFGGVAPPNVVVEYDLDLVLEAIAILP